MCCLCELGILSAPRFTGSISQAVGTCSFSTGSNDCLSNMDQNFQMVEMLCKHNQYSMSSLAKQAEGISVFLIIIWLMASAMAAES